MRVKGNGRLELIRKFEGTKGVLRSRKGQTTQRPKEKKHTDDLKNTKPQQ